jgi:enoyl-CoA hydratase/carnithine racemase
MGRSEVADDDDQRPGGVAESRPVRNGALVDVQSATHGTTDYEENSSVSLPRPTPIRRCVPSSLPVPARPFAQARTRPIFVQQAGASEQEEFLRDVESPLRIRKPLIAAMNGAAVGLGLLQALYCDVRFCVADAKLSAAFPRRGFVGEFGMVSILSSLAGRGRASDLLLSGRAFTGREAHAMGVVNFLAERDDVVADALSYAEDIGAHCSPHAMAVIKQQIRVEPQMEFWEALRHAEALQLASLTTPDVAEGFNAYFEKRDPGHQPLR